MGTKTKTEIAKVGIIGVGALGAGYILYRLTKDGLLNTKINEVVTKTKKEIYESAKTYTEPVAETVAKTKKEIYDSAKTYTEPVAETAEELLNELKDAKNNPTLTPQPAKKQITTAGGVIPLFSENSYTENPSTPRVVQGYWGETYLKPEPPAPALKEINKLGNDALKKGRKLLSEDERKKLEKALSILDKNMIEIEPYDTYKPVVVKKDVSLIDPMQREIQYAIARYEGNTVNDFARTKKTARRYKKKIYGGGILDKIRSWF